MKTKTLKNTGMAITLLAAIGQSGAVSAAVWDDTLGSVASAIDHFQVTCSNNGSGAPYKLLTQVLDKTPVATPIVSVRTFKGSLATNSADAIDGNATYSPAVYAIGGAGVYDVVVYKTALGAESYTLQYTCLTSTNVATGTVLKQLQNQ